MNDNNVKEQTFLSAHEKQLNNILSQAPKDKLFMIIEVGGKARASFLHGTVNPDTFVQLHDNFKAGIKTVLDRSPKIAPLLVLALLAKASKKEGAEHDFENSEADTFNKLLGSLQVSKMPEEVN